MYVTILSAQLEHIAEYHLEEAYQNDDGSFDPPHVAEWTNVAAHVIDKEELVELLSHVGNWSPAFQNEDDPRAAFRRVSAVRRAPVKETVSPALKSLIGLLDDLEVRSMWGSAGIFVRNFGVPLMTCPTSDTAEAILVALRKAKAHYA